MDTSNIKPKLIEISEHVKNKAAEAQHGAATFYAEHGVEVRLLANTGVYIAGAVIATTATTLTVKALGTGIAILGTIGLVGSAAEFWGRGRKRTA